MLYVVLRVLAIVRQPRIPHEQETINCAHDNEYVCVCYSFIMYTLVNESQH